MEPKWNEDLNRRPVAMWALPIKVSRFPLFISRFRKGVLTMTVAFAKFFPGLTLDWIALVPLFHSRQIPAKTTLLD
ncbi:hypothetical protein ACFQHW_11725 [Lapidilactobacillus achengensis]|uniref:Uncharacterized protein n=1 Tax=Lapidilactobacillus achengensis TaxID=2486000 RepID=A0ABW1UQI7_9LACO|nr:hypothetical protein [Lapidilactobacillus achengensis]